MTFVLPDSFRRAVRTFAQAFLGTLLTQWLALSISPGELPPGDVLRRVVTAAAVAGIVACVTWAHNALEDNTTFPAMLKSPPSAGQNPEPDPTHLGKIH